jgi:hypothetical protein
VILRVKELISNQMIDQMEGYPFKISFWFLLLKLLRVGTTSFTLKGDFVNTQKKTAHCAVHEDLSTKNPMI